MKKCTQCKHELPSDQFYEQTQRGENGKVWKYLDSMCKKCRLIYSSERRRKIKSEAVAYLGGKCNDCGLETPHSEVYDFHHVNPENKDFTIGKQAKKLDAIKVELDKCILLCANCHRIEHAG